MNQRLIINLRGANGSGKTTIAREILACKVQEMPALEYVSERSNKERKPKTRIWPTAKCQVPGIVSPVYVCGRYNVEQGGCDTEKDMDAIEHCVQQTIETFTDGHVFFEGFVVSKSGERWLTFSTRMRTRNLGQYLWLFLEPSIQDLEKRIKVRNGGKDIKLDRLQNTVECVQSIHRKARQIAPKNMVVAMDTSLSLRMHPSESLSPSSQSARR